MALVGNDFYVANTDAVMRFPYQRGRRRAITDPAPKSTDLPGGPINHHWTKNLIASPDGSSSMSTVGSNSNVAENGIEDEEQAAPRSSRSTARRGQYAASSPPACAIRSAWPGSRRRGALWTAVNERDELGSDLVPDYMTSVQDGGFYGWPYSYYGRTSTSACSRRGPTWSRRRSCPTTRSARTPRRSGSPSTGAMPFAALPRRRVRRPARLVESQAAQRLQGDFRAVRKRRRRPPEDVLTGFLDARTARARPPGRRGGRPRGALLVADDVGNVIWRVACR